MISIETFIVKPWDEIHQMFEDILITSELIEEHFEKCFIPINNENMLREYSSQDFIDPWSSELAIIISENDKQIVGFRFFEFQIWGNYISLVKKCLEKEHCNLLFGRGPLFLRCKNIQNEFVQFQIHYDDEGKDEIFVDHTFNKKEFFDSLLDGAIHYLTTLKRNGIVVSPNRRDSLNENDMNEILEEIHQLKTQVSKL